MTQDPINDTKGIIDHSVTNYHRSPEKFIIFRVELLIETWPMFIRPDTQVLDGRGKGQSRT
jgi:hypothetical protein